MTAQILQVPDRSRDEAIAFAYRCWVDAGAAPEGEATMGMAAEYVDRTGWRPTGDVLSIMLARLRT